MKYLIYLLAAGLLLAGLNSCVSSKTSESPTPSVTFGVLNSFPEHPNYLKNKTLVAMNKTDVIPTLSLKSQFTEVVTQFLTDKGYQVRVVDSKTALKEGQVDMLIEIVPREVHKMEGMKAYGFSDRKFLLGLVNQPPRSYVAMHLELSRGNSKRIIKTNREERFSDLGTDTMPDTWDHLTQEDKQKFEENLRENMDKITYIEHNGKEHVVEVAVKTIKGKCIAVV